MRQNEERHTEGIVAAPRAGRFVRVPPADDRSAAQDRGVEVLLVGTRGFAARLRLVGPGPTENPVVQSLAPLAETGAWAVVRPGDVAIERDRDASGDLGHELSPRIGPADPNYSYRFDFASLRFSSVGG